MLCCLNPDCDRPINPDNHLHCQNCGVPLVALLHSRFKVIKPIGRGGFGKTYLAEDTHKLNDRCVVKQLAYDGQGTRSVQQKVGQLFEQEAKQLQRLGENPQIPTLLAYFEEGGYLYLVQQFIEGDNLLKQLEKEGVFSENQIRQLLLDLLPILQFIHDRGTIHRDIKPENIMRRSPDNKPVLIDFGVSKLLSQTVMTGASAGTSLGSHGYSPLEQIREGKAVYASDLFALGATCFHLMSGIHPFHLWTDNGYGWVTDWRKHISNPISVQLGNILDKLLQKDVRDRYQSAIAVLQDLQAKPYVAPTVPIPTPAIAPAVPVVRPFFDPRVHSSAPPIAHASGGSKLKLALGFGIGITAVVMAVIATGAAIERSGIISQKTQSAPPPTTPLETPVAKSLTVQELIDRGNEKLTKGDRQGAIADYSEVIKIDPGVANAYYNRGNVYSDLGNKQTAIADFSKAIELNPKHTDAYNNRGNARHSLRDYQAAIADYNKAIAIDSKYTKAYFNRGNTHSDLGNYRAAIADYNKTLEIDPGYVNAYYRRGNVQHSLGEHQIAIADYNKAIQLDPKHASAYNNRGNVYYDLGNKQAAMADYSKVIEIDPTVANAYYNRANVRNDLGDRQSAIADYNKALQLDPNYASAYYNRGNVYSKLGNKAEAIADFQKAADLYQKAGQTKDVQDALNRIKKLQQ
ncbi:tetratricopeptide repeat protein [Pseudanabaena sp. PCC 6802]|uniref:serine/threonine-protein kinase n=1 Tax=Pseudanabaena sp. PCC 6802 TaxID=118173 RepID=UPI00034A26BB|nr:serine/threonine-protein kinase [Pseudanabaena sp. PCC 6802]